MDIVSGTRILFPTHRWALAVASLRRRRSALHAHRWIQIFEARTGRREAGRRAVHAGLKNLGDRYETLLQEQ